MLVIEQLVRGKHPDQALCEDAIAVTSTHAAIFDGAGRSGIDVDGVSGARFAAQTLAGAMEGLPGEASAVEARDHLTTELERSLTRRVGRVNAHERPAAVGVVFSAPRREIWRVGDPHFALDGEMHLGSLSIGPASAQFRALYLQLLLLAGEADRSSLILNDPTAQLLTPILDRIYLLRNSEGDSGWEFGAFDGSQIPRRFLEVTPVPSGAREVVLTSDGYPEPSPTLEMAERTIGDLLRDDPLCIGAFRAEKGLRDGVRSFDDRAYLRLAV